MSISMMTPHEVQAEIAQNFKTIRLAKKLTQEGLANRSGVSYGTIKKFESTSKISMESLLKIALVLGILESFSKLNKHKSSKFDEQLSLDTILKEEKKNKKPQRGTIK